MAYQIHHVPGRLRIRIPALYQSSMHATAVIGLLAALPGVESVAANPLSRSAVVHYSPLRIHSSQIMAALRDHGYGEAPREPEVIRPAGRLKEKLTEAALMFVLEKAIERSIPAVLALIL